MIVEILEFVRSLILQDPPFVCKIPSSVISSAISCTKVSSIKCRISPDAGADPASAPDHAPDPTAGAVYSVSEAAAASFTSTSTSTFNIHIRL